MGAGLSALSAPLSLLLTPTTISASRSQSISDICYRPDLPVSRRLVESSVKSANFFRQPHELLSSVTKHSMWLAERLRSNLRRLFCCAISMTYNDALASSTSISVYTKNPVLCLGSIAPSTLLCRGIGKLPTSWISTKTGMISFAKSSSASKHSRAVMKESPISKSKENYSLASKATYCVR